MKRVMMGMTILTVLAIGGGVKADYLALDFTGGSTYFASQDSGSPYTIGWKFTTTQTLTVSGLGFWDEADHTLGFTHDVGLWNASGNLLASTTITSTSTPVSSTAPGQWLFNTISGTTLAPGTYFVGAEYTSTDNQDAYRYYTNAPTTAAGVTYGTGTYVFGAGLNFPSLGAYPNCYFGPNLEFSSLTTVPEPSSFALLGLATIMFAGYCGWRRRKLVAA